VNEKPIITDNSFGSQNNSRVVSSQKKMKCVKYSVYQELSQNRESNRPEFRESTVEGASEKEITLCQEDLACELKILHVLQLSDIRSYSFTVINPLLGNG
jgi:hypothetical protein